MAQGFLMQVFRSLPTTSRLLLNNPNHQNRIVPIRSQGLKQSVEEKLKELKIPDKPKRPLTAYLRFVRDQRVDLIKDNPHLKVTEITRKCADEWRQVGTQVKQKYEDQYKSELESYTKQFQVYTSKLTEEQKDALKSFQQDAKDAKHKRLLKKKVRDLNKPKRPIGAYMLFVMDRAKAQSDKTIPELLSALKSAWSHLPESEKEKYTSTANRERERYHRELKLWEETMLKEGNEDLVRHSTLSELRPSSARKRSSASKAGSSK